ncbi:hypothetical protein C0V72_14875 [Porphyrobacter sp. TH134]|uniref:hypothetical protein n=1 Tax=Porphyrobacter sp. TH134 TaxID=2067450 RepID=UPI000C7AC998|nr:hypothetical protein [Porphyrobacter sp. TH134]PLK22439.1 hypothetical protein C0V72_14875 [Porphyrobacter sp. TH134]
MSKPEHDYRREPTLPWGYWLQHEPDYSTVRDEGGRKWPSLHHYFYVHRMRMHVVSPYKLEQTMRRLLAVLCAIERRCAGIEELAIDVFAGDRDATRHFLLQCETERLTDRGMLTVEGRAVLHMLELTQSPRAPVIPVGVADIPRAHPDDPATDAEERERVFAAQEAFAREHLRFRFIREEIVKSPGIKLVGLALGGPMPFTRVIWSMQFANEAARDRMFAWLTLRLHRWDHWAELVLRGGAMQLTELLLQLTIADPRDS